MLSPHEYSELSAAVVQHGFHALVRYDDAFGYRLICASKRRIPTGYTGNSFWVIVKDNQWYIASWGYRYWHIPRAESVLAVCIEWLSGDTGVGCPSDEALRNHDLEEVELDEFGAVFIDTLIPAALRDIWRCQQRHREHTHRFAATLSELSEVSERAPWEHLPKEYQINIVLDGESWSATAESKKDSRGFMIDVAGNVSVLVKWGRRGC
jgi:hypothetical protein